MKMTYTILPVHFKKKTYLFDKIRGCLYAIDSDKDEVTKPMIDSVVENPFLLQNRQRSVIADNQVCFFSELYAKLLIWFCAHCYLMAFILSHLNFAVYEDAGIANQVFIMSTKGYKQNCLCLPRSIFIATTSKKFRKHGCMYIGCFFPSRHMHAWVIEENMQADVYDNIWICYTPVIKMQR